MNNFGACGGFINRRQIIVDSSSIVYRLSSKIAGKMPAIFLCCPIFSVKRSEPYCRKDMPFFYHIAFLEVGYRP